MYFRLLSAFLLVASFTKLSAQSYSKLVNPFIGTGGHGHTFPGAVMPFGGCQLSPDTRLEGWDGCGGYHYSDSVIYGFSHTHLSGTGCSDYGDILLMPVTKFMALDRYQYASKFSHSSEQAQAGYYSVLLQQSGIFAELTATTRGGFHQYTYPNNSDVYVVLDLKHRDQVLDSRIEQVDEYTLRGYRFSKAWANQQKLYYEIRFSLPIESIQYDAMGPKGSLTGGIALEKSMHAILKFKHVQNKESKAVLKVKTALSGVDEEGAHKNLLQEMPDAQWDFAAYRNACEKAWDLELGKIQPVGSLPALELEKFYTALYHCMIHPSIYSDVDGRYRGRDDRIHTTNGAFDYYTVFSLWDTYRALHPLLTILDKKRTNDFIQTFIRQYEEGGRLPIWELSSNETNCMIGYHVVSVIWDAYNKGIRDYDAEKAYEAMTRIATHFTDYEGEGLSLHLKEEARARAADADALESYNRFGYVRSDDSHESVSKTLEYAYNDWCIAQMALALGKKEDHDYYLDRSRNWMNVYDPSTGFMRARKNGCLYQPFSPYMVDNNYTEANSWQYSFYMPHDVLAYIDLLGSKEAFEKKLDDLFQANTKTEGREQSDITGLIGQYAHGNEPSHHIVYLYNYIGQREKMQKLVKQICDSFYTNKPDGLIGNEDCGQMSAWYVCSKLGLYPTCPGENNYDAVDTAASFVMNLDFPHEIDLCKVYHTGYEDGFQATRLLIRPEMKTRDWSRVFPHRPGKLKKFATVPYMEGTHGVFEDSVRISFGSPNPGLPVSYSINNGPFTNFTEPFYLSDHASIRFYSLRNTESFRMQEARFTRLPKDRKVFTNSKPHASYTAGGPQALVNQIHGKLNWRAGDWQGYQGQDIEMVLRFDSSRSMQRINTTFLEDQNSWIFYPTELSYAVSTDSVHWVEIQTIATNKSDHDLTVSIASFPCDLRARLNELNVTNSHWKFVRVRAKNYGKMPDWHEGRGYPTYLFIDEIEVD